MLPRNAFHIISAIQMLFSSFLVVVFGMLHPCSVPPGLKPLYPMQPSCLPMLQVQLPSSAASPRRPPFCIALVTDTVIASLFVCVTLLRFQLFEGWDHFCHVLHYVPLPTTWHIVGVQLLLSELITEALRASEAELRWQPRTGTF